MWQWSSSSSVLLSSELCLRRQGRIPEIVSKKLNKLFDAHSPGRHSYWKYINREQFFPKGTGNLKSYATLISGSGFYFKELSFLLLKYVLLALALFLRFPKSLRGQGWWVGMHACISAPVAARSWGSVLRKLQALYLLTESYVCSLCLVVRVQNGGPLCGIVSYLHLRSV